jgi:hypothetical protein
MGNKKISICKAKKCLEEEMYRISPKLEKIPA